MLGTIQYNKDFSTSRESLFKLSTTCGCARTRMGGHIRISHRNKGNFFAQLQLHGHVIIGNCSTHVKPLIFSASEKYWNDRRASQNLNNPISVTCA